MAGLRAPQARPRFRFADATGAGIKSTGKTTPESGTE